MAVFSDVDILAAVKSGKIKVTPFNPEAVQPGSLELTLGNEFLVFRFARRPIIDTKAGKPLQDLTEKITVKDGEGFYILPGELVLASTKEVLELAPDVCGLLEGRSSFARMGLMVHATSSFLHPGSRGRQTLEMSNMTSLPVIVYPGQRLCQMVFLQTLSPAKTPYFKKKGAKYLDQKGPEASKLYLE
jgi:dCTP deaminase